MFYLKNNFNFGKAIFKKNSKKIISIAIVMVITICNTTFAIADSNVGDYDFEQKVSGTEVSYSIIDSLKNKDYSKFDEYADTNEVYIGTLPDSVNIDDNNLLVNESRILAYIQKLPLTPYSCNSTIETLLSCLNSNKNANNCTYWSTKNDDYLNDENKLIDSYSEIDFDSWNKNTQNGLVVSFRCYKKARAITMKVMLNTESIVDCELTDGQTLKLFHELEQLSKSNENLTVSTVNNNGWYKKSDGEWYFSENGIDTLGWKNMGSSWYYFSRDTGAMSIGWQYIGNEWYYFYSDGSMAKRIWINGYWVNDEGVFIK